MERIFLREDVVAASVQRGRTSSLPNLIHMQVSAGHFDLPNQIKSASDARAALARNHQLMSHIRCSDQNQLDQGPSMLFN
jgi:hypothetical protein